MVKEDYSVRVEEDQTLLAFYHKFLVLGVVLLQTRKTCNNDLLLKITKTAQEQRQTLLLVDLLVVPVDLLGPVCQV